MKHVVKYSVYLDILLTLSIYVTTYVFQGKPKNGPPVIQSWGPHEEFIAFCLDGLHEDLNRVVEKRAPRTEDEEKASEALSNSRGEDFAAALSWRQYLEYGKSFLVDLLQVR